MGGGDGEGEGEGGREKEVKKDVRKRGGRDRNGLDEREIKGKRKGGKEMQWGGMVLM